MRFLLAATLAGLGAAPVLAQDLELFRTPSDNIHCLFIDEGGDIAVECELRQRAEGDPARPRPADCELDWGSRFALAARGEAGLVCHGDTLLSPGSPILAYGETRAHTGITCHSEKSGLTCRNLDGHGFRLARAKQELF
jgi:hypothetical protein